jgi:hypothetical protein
MAKSNRRSAPVKAKPAQARPGRDFTHSPVESAEAFADRRDLLRALQNSAGFKLVGEIVRTAEVLDLYLRKLMSDHAEGSGSPLARYTRRHGEGFWEDVTVLLYNLRSGVSFIENQLPPLPDDHKHKALRGV